MSRRKKNGFITFCCSFMPGAGEMYMGFLKMGVSLMSLFLGVAVLGSVLDLGELVLVDVVIWFYSFFHVHNLAGLTDAEFAETKDEFLFHVDDWFRINNKNRKKYRNVVAVILIIVGVLMLWDGLKMTFMAYLPEVVLRMVSRLEHTIPKILAGIGIIIAGFYMIRGKQEELKALEEIPERSEHGREEEHQDA